MRKPNIDEDFLDLKYDNGIMPLDESSVNKNNELKMGNANRKVGVKTYFTNLTKSVAKMTIKIGDQYMPNATSFGRELIDIGKSFKDSMMEEYNETANYVSKMTKLAKDILGYEDGERVTLRSLGQRAKTAASEMMKSNLEMLKSGKFYYDEEEEFAESFENEFGSFEGFENESADFESYGDSKNTDVSDRSSRSKKSKKSVSQGELMLSETVATSNARLMETNTDIAKMQMKQQESLFKRNAALQEASFRINYKMQKALLFKTTTISNFLTRVSKEHIKASMEYYIKSFAIQQDILALNKEMREMMAVVATSQKYFYDKSIYMDSKNERSGGQSVYEKIFGSSFSGAEYGKMIASNIKNEFLSPLQMLTMIDPDMIAMGIDPLNGNIKGSYKKLAKRISLPNLILKGLFNFLIGERGRESLNRVNDIFDVLPSNLISSVNRFRYSNNKFLRAIGNVAEVKFYNVGRIDTGISDPTAEARFDAQTHRTINVVMPTYLSKILAALTNKEELLYDYSSGTFKRASEAYSNFKDELKINRLTDYRFNAFKKGIYGKLNANETYYSNKKNYERYIERIFDNIIDKGLGYDPDLAVRNSSFRDAILGGIPDHDKENVLALFNEAFNNLEPYKRMSIGAAAKIKARELSNTRSFYNKNKDTMLGLVMAEDNSLYVSKIKEEIEDLQSRLKNAGDDNVAALNLKQRIAKLKAELITRDSGSTKLFKNPDANDRTSIDRKDLFSTPNLLKRMYRLMIFGLKVYNLPYTAKVENFYKHASKEYKEAGKYEVMIRNKYIEDRKEKIEEYRKSVSEYTESAGSMRSKGVLEKLGIINKNNKKDLLGKIEDIRNNNFLANAVVNLTEKFTSIVDKLLFKPRELGNAIKNKFKLFGRNKTQEDLSSLYKIDIASSSVFNNESTQTTKSSKNSIFSKIYDPIKKHNYTGGNIVILGGAGSSTSGDTFSDIDNIISRASKRNESLIKNLERTLFKKEYEKTERKLSKKSMSVIEEADTKTRKNFIKNKLSNIEDKIIMANYVINREATDIYDKKIKTKRGKIEEFKTKLNESEVVIRAYIKEVIKNDQVDADILLRSNTITRNMYLDKLQTLGLITVKNRSELDYLLDTYNRLRNYVEYKDFIKKKNLFTFTSTNIKRILFETIGGSSIAMKITKGIKDTIFKLSDKKGSQLAGYLYKSMYQKDDYVKNIRKTNVLTIYKELDKLAKESTQDINTIIYGKKGGLRNNLDRFKNRLLGPLFIKKYSNKMFSRLLQVGREKGLSYETMYALKDMDNEHRSKYLDLLVSEGAITSENAAELMMLFKPYDYVSNYITYKSKLLTPARLLMRGLKTDLGINKAIGKVRDKLDKLTEPIRNFFNNEKLKFLTGSHKGRGLGKIINFAKFSLSDTKNLFKEHGIKDGSKRVFDRFFMVNRELKNTVKEIYNDLVGIGIDPDFADLILKVNEFDRDKIIESYLAQGIIKEEDVPIIRAKLERYDSLKYYSMSRGMFGFIKRGVYLMSSSAKAVLFRKNLKYRIGEAFKPLKENIDKKVESLRKLITGAKEKISGWAEGVGLASNKIIAATQKFIGKSYELFKSISSFAKKVAGEIGGKISSAGKAVGGFASKIFGSVKKGLGKVADFIRKLLPKKLFAKTNYRMQVKNLYEYGKSIGLTENEIDQLIVADNETRKNIFDALLYNGKISVENIPVLDSVLTSLQESRSIIASRLNIFAKIKRGGQVVFEDPESANISLHEKITRTNLYTKYTGDANEEKGLSKIFKKKQELDKELILTNKEKRKPPVQIVSQNKEAINSLFSKLTDLVKEIKRLEEEVCRLENKGSVSDKKEKSDNTEKGGE